MEREDVVGMAAGTAPARKQRLIVLVSGLGVLALWVYLGYVVIPGFRRAVQLSQEVWTARDQLLLLQRVVANEAEIREQHDQVEAVVVSLRSHLPSEDQLSEVIERLSELARRTGVRLEAVSPQLVPAQPSGEDSMPEEVYRAIPIQIEASAGYHNIGAFLSLIETESSPMELVELRIAGHPSDPYRHKLELRLNVFFITREEAGLSS